MSYVDPETGEVLSEEIELVLSIAQTASAWRVSGDTPPSAKVTLEIPANQFARAVRLMGWSGMPLKAVFSIDTAN